MNDKQIERLLTAFEIFACGVDKIGDGVKSMSTFIWLPVYIGCFLILVFIIGYLLFSLS